MKQKNKYYVQVSEAGRPSTSIRHTTTVTASNEAEAFILGQEWREKLVEEKGVRMGSIEVRRAFKKSGKGTYLPA